MDWSALALKPWVTFPGGEPGRQRHHEVGGSIGISSAVRLLTQAPSVARRHQLFSLLRAPSAVPAQCVHSGTRGHANLKRRDGGGMAAAPVTVAVPALPPGAGTAQVTGAL